MIAAVGFDHPENLVYDSVADVYLVSNTGGGGSAHDGNGFISRVAPDGTVLDLRWIASGVSDVTLDSPKGLAIRGDTLAVADLDRVRLFDRRSGAPLRTILVGGVALNDLVMARDGGLWITDMGPSRDSTPVDTTHGVDAVWHVSPNGTVRAVTRGLSLDRPNGIVLDREDVLVATFGAHRLQRIRPGSTLAPTMAFDLPAGRLDGVHRMGDGSLLVTSWDGSVVWRLMPNGDLRRVLADVVSPAGIAVDTKRHLLAVTSFQTNTLYLVPLA